MIQIRKGTKSDLPSAFELIKELALFEKAPDEVSNTLEMMEKDGFGEHPIYWYIVAEDGGEIVGMSMYYYRYSTWKGKRLYLEDLVVTESRRGTGIGKMLFERTVEIGKETDCTGMMWQVLDWNEPAINFYQEYGTKMDSGWLNCSLNF
ncbi:MAG: GNAT superfamily N-acetyltransferase [Cyclobacteriaceae bacterium]|jgi:GNAT superfamily N-acetyltransferase